MKITTQITKFYQLSIGDKFYVNGQEYIKKDMQTAKGKTNSLPSHFEGTEIVEM